MANKALYVKCRMRAAQGQEPTQPRFARRLRQAIAWAGISQRALCREAGIGHNMITCYLKPEYQHGPPVAYRRRHIEQTLDLPIYWLDQDTPLPKRTPRPA